MRRFSAVAVGAAVLAALAPSAVIPATKDVVVSWAEPTPGDGTVLGVSAKTQLSFRVAASSGVPGVTVKIRATSGSPAGAKLWHADGNPAKATFTWTPRVSQVGVYRVTLTATSEIPVGHAQRTFVLRVGPPNRPPPGPTPPRGVYPQRLVLSDYAQETYRWAFVRHRTVARTGPSRKARAISRVEFRTPELYRNAIQVLNGIRYKNGRTWVRIRLAVLPNGSTGWVPRGSLTAFNKIHKRLVINHRTLRATLYNRGRPVFRTIVGVGQSQWPTPRGDFHVREKLSGYYAPAYGPRAFGLNARSTKLTDWPGGGFIGIHGTNAPSILPGRVSHGCVRMRNGPILRLFQIMPLGTPVQIR